MADNSKFILICDESGAVGFTDRPVNDDEPIGIVAGLLLSEDDFIAIKDELASIVKKYESQDGKLHIVGLTDKSKEKLRQDIFGLIDVSDARIVYEAIVHKDIQERCAQEQKIFDDYKKRKEAAGYLYNVPQIKERILSALFQCCFIRALHSDMVENMASSCCEFVIYTDLLDEPILDEIRAKIYDYLNNQLVIERKGPFQRFNKTKNQVESLEGKAVANIILSEKIKMKDNSKIKFELIVNSSLGLLADVIANSLRHTLKNSYLKNKSIKLFSPQSVAGHPLSNYIQQINAAEDFDLFLSMNFVQIKNCCFVLPEGITFDINYFVE